MARTDRQELPEALEANRNPCGVSRRMEERLEKACCAVEKIPVWQVVATGQARRIRAGVAIRCINDAGHAIDILFKADDWDYVREVEA